MALRQNLLSSKPSKPIKSSSRGDAKFYSALPGSGPATTMQKTLPVRHDCSGGNTKPKKEPLTWQRLASPAVMTLCFALGIALALGHHLYYQWLDGQVVTGLSRQQWSLRIGNFFAVATATSLKLAMANACMQYIWLRLRQKPHKLETIDAAFCMTGDIFPFFHTDLYKSLYIGVVLAMLIWAVPIASLFPPATLSVVLDLHTKTSTFDALQPSISAPQPVNQYGRDPNETYSSAYTEAPDTFATLVKSVAYAGQITAPQALLSVSNYSYILNTYIPRFKCSPDSNDLHTRILDAAQELLLNVSDITSFNKDTFAYVDGEFAENGLDNAGNGLLFYLGLATLAGTKLDAEDLGTMGLPQTQVLIDADDTDLNSLISEPLRDAISGSVIFAILTGPGQISFTNCAFYNSSFETITSFTNGIGTIRVVSITDISEIRNFSTSLGAPTSYLHYFQEMSKLFVGSMTAEDTVESFEDPDPEVFRMPLSTTPIESTILAQANDFSDMLRYRADWIGDANNNTQPSQNKTFSTLLDELSVNISLSLMSSPSLCRTVSVTGEIQNLYTVYHYQPMNLLISYGVAMACSLASIVVGFIAFCHNRESHDAKISTIGSVMQTPELAPLMRRPVDVVHGDKEEDKRKQQVWLRLDSYVIEESDDVDSHASSESTGLPKRRFVGFVAPAGLDGLMG